MNGKSIFGTAALCLLLAKAALAGGEAKPLTLGDYAIGVLRASTDLKLQKAGPARVLGKVKTQLSLENRAYDKPYSVSSEAFVSKYSIASTSADLSEIYAVYVSSPQSNRIVYRIDRGLDYPHPMARPRLTDVTAAMTRKWGDPNNGGVPLKFNPGETVSLVWFYRRDGSKYERYGGCEAIWHNGTTINAYGLDLREPVGKASSTECDGFVTAEIAVDDDLFVQGIKFSTYSNQALDVALTRDFEALDSKLNALLDKTVASHRRVLPPPDM
ncbi:MAG: hypothetical protein ACOH2J_04110 [Allorhizobium sp.]